MPWASQRFALLGFSYEKVKLKNENIFKLFTFFFAFY